MVYDHRNLLIESMNTISPNFTFRTRYYYDEADNRIRKYVLKSTIEDPGLPNWDNLDEPGDGWGVYSNEYYVRDVSGKEIAIYSGNDVEQWNIWGLDNVGKVNSDRNRYFYIKDHLGSIRAVIDTSNSVVSAQDYDAWGYLLEGKSSGYDRYKFTSKEQDKDNENNYYYFGARYYDSRIGRWGGVEPLLSKYSSWSPYQNALCNPIRFIDVNGNDVDISEVQKYDEEHNTDYTNLLINSLMKITGLRIEIENGKLVYYEQANIKGSKTARAEIIRLIGHDLTLNVKITAGNRSFSIRNSRDVNLSPSAIQAMMDGAKNGLNPETIGWAMTLFHEAKHTVLAEREYGNDPIQGQIGDIEGFTNVIRTEMGEDYGYRASYGWDLINEWKYIPFSIYAKKQIFEDHVEPSSGYFIKWK